MQSSDPDVMEHLRQMQIEWDRKREETAHIMRFTSPDPEKLHRLMLFSMTTTPDINMDMLVLGWMQHEPHKWAGLSPDHCVHVAEQKGIGVEA